MSPSAIPVLRRSKVEITVDTATAGGDSAVNIENGAQVPGYMVRVATKGPAGRKAVVTYAPGVAVDVWVGMSLCFVWNGAAWERYQSIDGGALMLNTLIAEAGLTLDLSDAYQLTKATIGMSHKIGQLVPMEAEDAPVDYASSKSSANPANPEYNPVIPRHDADHDVASTQAPLLVTKFRAIKAKVGATDAFLTASVVGSVITLANNATNDRFLAGLVAVGMANRYYTAGKIATWAAGGVDFASATRAYCVNDGTADFPVTAVNLGARTITVTGSPASVASISCHPFRIAGEALKIRLRRIDGFALVAGGSDESEPLIAFVEMDRMQEITGSALFSYGAMRSGSGAISKTVVASATNATYGGSNAQDLFDFNSSNSPNARTGKSTEVKRLGVALYTWARTLLATNWT
jgi:hypothetical protein